jgi:CTP:molybdopterin cytidylyltransferase MocA
MSENFFANTSCIILSAGSSERMGMHKALLKFDDRRNFIQQITEEYLKAGVEQIIVVVNNEIYGLSKKGMFQLSEKVELVVNEHIELGRFYSLQKGVQQLIPNNHCFFQNIDNPLVSDNVLENLIKHKHKADVLIPVFENKPGHPVLFSPLVAQEIIKNGDFGIRIDQFLKGFNNCKIETNDNSILLNINFIDEYLAFIQKQDVF